MGLADEILGRWAPIVLNLDMSPGTGGVFDITLDGEVMFTIMGKDRFPTAVELADLLQPVMGPPLRWRADARYKVTRRVKRALKIGPFKRA